MNICTVKTQQSQKKINKDNPQFIKNIQNHTTRLVQSKVSEMQKRLKNYSNKLQNKTFYAKNSQKSDHCEKKRQNESLNKIYTTNSDKMRLSFNSGRFQDNIKIMNKVNKKQEDDKNNSKSTKYIKDQEQLIINIKNQKQQYKISSQTKLKLLLQNNKNSLTIPNSQIISAKYKNGINRSRQILQSLKQKSSKNKKILKQPEYIQGFTLGKLLGKGKFGQVCLSKHNETGCILAIKKIKKQKLIQFKMVNQFIKQIKLHTFLDHPKIVKFYGFFQQKQYFYLLLQFMNGGTLFQHLNRVQKLDIKEAVQFLKDIIQALIYLHDKSIAHRDIKPQNIVISTQGIAKLCDFGWATLVSDQRNTYCGTLDYASPEILSRKGYDTSVDVWSIGILTYQLLMGHAPFQNDNRQKVKQNILKANPNQFTYLPSVPSQAKQFIQWLVQKDPSKRPKAIQLLSHKLFSVYGKTYKKSL